MQAAIRTAVKSAYVPFTAAHRYFYDVLGSPDSADDSPQLAPYAAPPGWARREWGPWVAYLPPAPVPDAGWKVHVSALPTTAARVVAIVLEHCCDLGIPVKTLRSEHHVLVSSAKYADVTASGKVVTAYPADADLAARLLDRLAVDLADEPGPRILGELRVAGTPVHLRHGAFVEGWFEATDGRLRPGRREGSHLTNDPRGAQLLRQRQVLPEQLHRFVTAEAPATLDIEDVVVLHRSNGGAVYRARWKGGATVVLKEAQRHTGLDAGGVDAATRLLHEHAVLTRLSGTGIVPEVIDRVTVGSSEFLVMEHVEGQLLSASLAAHHPGSTTGSSMSAASYRAWVEGTTGRLREHVHALAAHGVSHGDLHPGNVIETSERLVLVDLESASLDGHCVSLGVAAEGFSSGRNPDLADDLHAIARVRLTLLSPHTGLLPWRPDLEAVLEQTGLADIEQRSAERGPASAADGGGVSPADAEALAAGIRACATPHRGDRLFPGDIAQFTTPGAGLGLLSGAAGVLLALEAAPVAASVAAPAGPTASTGPTASAGAAGAAVDAGWLDWLVGQARTTLTVGGLGHGLEGVALALALLGRSADAREIAALALAREVPERLDPWWEFGHSGRALAFAELAVLLDDPALDRAADSHLAATLDALAGRRGPLEAEAGLTGGWSGVALALTAIADLSDGIRRSTCLQAALRAVLAEADSCIQLGTGLFATQGSTALPHLGSGSAAVGLAAQAVLDRRALGVTADAASVSRLEWLVAGTRATCAVPVVAGAGLLSGRSGLLAALRRLTSDTEPAVRIHAERLGWYAVPLDDLALPSSPAASAGRAAQVLLGHANLRLSTDVATGSAGALLALAPRGSDLLHKVLRLPAVTPPSAPDLLHASTVVTALPASA